MPCTNLEGGREHREEPKLHRKAWVESDRWRCTRARKVGNVVSSFQTRTACNEHVSFTNSDLADIHFIYGLADGNGRAAVRLYRKGIQRGGNRIIKRLLGCIKTW
ncbi:hypothetical protein TNCV_2550511 [Trichonephila clavipes]|nr:hypothetical protein TNCV_2550511 [Trichonephila clavipes]